MTTPALQIVKARVGLEQVHETTLYEIIEHSDLFCKEADELWDELSAHIMKKWPKDTMLRGRLNVGSPDIETLIERIGDKFVGGKFHTVWFPEGGQSRQYVSLITTDRLWRGDQPVMVDKFVSYLIKHEQKIRTLFLKSRRSRTEKKECSQNYQDFLDGIQFDGRE